MNANHILDALEQIDDEYILDAKRPDGRQRKKGRRLICALLIAAAITVLLTLGGIATYHFSGYFNDRWVQEPSASPEDVVRSAIENQDKKDYTLAIRVDTVAVDEAETARVIAMYQGSELAAFHGWSDEYLAEHFLVVRAAYYAEYDHTKTFLPDGNVQQDFYLTQDVTTGEWTIFDNTSPVT